MKKICILLAFVLCCVAVQAQSTCKVQGVVRYYYNDTFKYRPDLGAEIRFIPKTKQDTILKLKSFGLTTQKLTKY